MPRYLTKSRFKLALECTAKLFYTGKKEYVDKKLDDEFMKALAEGGFQVGELAKIYFEGGHNIDELDHAIALTKTSELLKLENVVIYEAAFLFGDLFVRADIVCKKGYQIELIEVKSKSYDPAGEGFLNTKDAIRPAWEPYLFDVAFQYYVLTKAHPHFKVTPYLMLADKSSMASIEGLNQCFQLQRNGNRTKAIATPGTTKSSVGNPVLIQINVNSIVKEILSDKHSTLPFERLINDFATHYKNDKLLLQPLGKRCKECEFKADNVDLAKGLRSGFRECWEHLAGFTEVDFNSPSILDVWDFRKKDEFLQNKIYFQDQLSKSDFESNSRPKKGALVPVGLSRTDRQFLQIEKSKSGDSSCFLDKSAIKEAMKQCIYPLHFIDFETTAVALPFNKGKRPYEQTAFQFSHHTLSENDTIEHAGQWINTEVGKFPNYDFLRELKKELEKDSGSIFRYAAHENTILTAIYEQLQKSSESDKDSLCAFIRTITRSKNGSAEQWEGGRNMIDMLDWVKKFYYSPSTNGSNSIKQVLPAILRDSILLKEKYSKPIYGKDIKSLNFNGHAWITFDKDGKINNPYHTLPNIHEGYDNESLDLLALDEEAGIFDGGAAMTAYARMQFTQMSDTERTRTRDALLRYCELDTMAMVMLWEGWKDLCK